MVGWSQEKNAFGSYQSRRSRNVFCRLFLKYSLKSNRTNVKTTFACWPKPTRTTCSSAARTASAPSAGPTRPRWTASRPSSTSTSSPASVSARSIRSTTQRPSLQVRKKNCFSPSGDFLNTFSQPLVSGHCYAKFFSCFGLISLLAIWVALADELRLLIAT